MLLKLKPLIEDYIYLIIENNMENVFLSSESCINIFSLDKIIQNFDKYLKNNLVTTILNPESPLLNYPKEILNFKDANVNECYSYLLISKIINNRYYGTLFPSSITKKKIYFVPLYYTKTNIRKDCLVISMFENESENKNEPENKNESENKSENKSEQDFLFQHVYDNFFFLKSHLWFRVYPKNTLKDISNIEFEEREKNTDFFYENHYPALVEKDISYERMKCLFEGVEKIFFNTCNKIDKIFLDFFEKKNHQKKINFTDLDKYSKLENFILTYTYITDKKSYISIDNLYEKYKNWCSTRNEEIENIDIFISILEKIYKSLLDINNNICYSIAFDNEKL